MPAFSAGPRRKNATTPRIQVEGGIFAFQGHPKDLRISKDEVIRWTVVHEQTLAGMMQGMLLGLVGRMIFGDARPGLPHTLQITVKGPMPEDVRVPIGELEPESRAAVVEALVAQGWPLPDTTTIGSM